MSSCLHASFALALLVVVQNVKPFSVRHPRYRLACSTNFLRRWDLKLCVLFFSFALARSSLNFFFSKSFLSRNSTKASARDTAAGWAIDTPHPHPPPLDCTSAQLMLSLSAVVYLSVARLVSSCLLLCLPLTLFGSLQALINGFVGGSHEQFVILVREVRKPRRRRTKKKKCLFRGLIVADRTEKSIWHKLTSRRKWRNLDSAGSPACTDFVLPVTSEFYIPWTWTPMHSKFLFAQSSSDSLQIRRRRIHLALNTPNWGEQSEFRFHQLGAPLPLELLIEAHRPFATSLCVARAR